MSLFLQTFKIDVERKHAIFGDVKEYIFNTLKAKKYLEIETDQVSKKVTFKWGPRSEIEISKHDILNFVCKVIIMKRFNIHNECFKTFNFRCTKIECHHHGQIILILQMNRT